MQGIDRATAQRIMSIWRKAGAVRRCRFRRRAHAHAAGSQPPCPPPHSIPHTAPHAALRLQADPDSLRKLFLKRSLGRSTQIVVQLLVDAAAGGGAYYAARTITPDQLGTWSLAAKYGL